LIKNEEETETITFQISTTELTKRKAKNKKKVTLLSWLFFVQKRAQPNGGNNG